MKTIDTQHTRYGASELKEGYNRHLGLAFFLSIGLHALAVGVYLILNPAVPAPLSVVPEHRDTIIVLPPVPEPKTPADRSAEKGGGGRGAANDRGGAPHDPADPVADRPITAPQQGSLPLPTSTPLDDSLLARSTTPHQGPIGGGGGHDTIPNGGGTGNDPKLPPGTSFTDDTLDPGTPNFAEVTPEYDPGELRRALRYPEIARRTRLEGVVVVRVLVDRIGKPRRAMIDQSPSPLLSQAAMEAVLAIAFTPAIQNGSPVPVWIQVPITFELD